MDAYRIAEGSSVDLASIDPNEKPGFDGKKKAGVAELRRLRTRLAELQYKLYADGSQKLLIVLQAMDSGGKDGTIRKVFQGVNPQGVRVKSFKKPSTRELAHDYLWRVHQHTPQSGMIKIFNRSHYEDVLAVRVLDLVPAQRWQRRYSHINDFERLLTDEGTTILKFYLHISREEQRERLQARLDNPDKNWKFTAADLDSRALWDDYTVAYTEMLERTSTECAPWYVVPANRKWYRNIVVARTIIATLEELDLRFPEPEAGIADIVVT